MASTGGTRWGTIGYWLVFLGVPVGIVIGTPHITENPEVARRGASRALEIAGTLVLIGVLTYKKRQVYSGPPLRRQVVRWFRRWLPWSEPEGRTVQVSAGAHGVVGGQASLTKRASEDADLETRVEILESRLESLRSDVSEYRSEAQEKRKKIKQSLSDLREDYRDEVERLDRKIEDLEAGSFHWEAMGLLWIMAGIVVSVGGVPFPGF